MAEFHYCLIPGSSPVDWCEDNYRYSPNIAEFVNTFSNILFIVIPPLLMYLFQEYGKYANPGIHIVWILLIIVGLSSAYFHATLSFLGQLLDELAILWVFMAAFSLFCPKRYYPKYCNSDRKTFSKIMFYSALSATILSVWQPVINAFFLMALSVPTMLMLYKELQRVKCPKVYRLGMRSIFVWGISAFFWIQDRMFCEAWTSINFPYLHGFWHIGICIAAYTCLVLFSYFCAENEQAHKLPVLRYWPNNFEICGVPYVTFKDPYASDKNEI